MGWVAKHISSEIAEYVFNIRITLTNRSLFQRDVRPDLTIDFDGLENQLAELPEMLCFFDQLLAEQRATVSTLEAEQEVTKATIIDEIIDRSRQQGIKTSVQVMNNIINADDRMTLLQAKIIKEEKAENKIRAVVNALQRKSDHLRSLAGFKREEKKQA
jgi:hypothetical protein